MPSGGATRTEGPFVAGELVQWWDARGRRTGRFVGVVVRGRHRGAAQVAVGGTIVAERIMRVPMDGLSAVGTPAVLFTREGRG
jgi:hypothetical protein